MGHTVIKINFQLKTKHYISPRKQVFVHQLTALATRQESVSVFFTESPKQTKMKWSPEKDVLLIF